MNTQIQQKVECNICHAQVESYIYDYHQSQCQNFNQQQRNQPLRSGQQQRNSNQNQQNSRNRQQINQQQQFYSQNSDVTQQNRRNPEIFQQQQQQQSPLNSEILCEYCQENYPAQVLVDHVEVCEARIFLLQLQNDEGQQQNNQNINQPNQNQSYFNDQNQTEIQLVPGETRRTEALQPDGSVIITIQKRDHSGNITTTIETQGRNGSRSVQTMTQNNAAQIQRTKKSTLPDGSIKTEIISTDNMGNISTQTNIQGPNGMRQQQSSQNYNSINRNINPQPQIQDQRIRQQYRNIQQQYQNIQQQYQNQNRQQSRDLQQFFSRFDSSDSEEQSSSPQEQSNLQSIRRLSDLAELISLMDARPQQNAIRGLKSQDLQNINTVKYQATAGLTEENKRCVICITDYNQGEELKILPCLHRFHKNCIDTWLVKNPHCPICKKNVLF